MQMLLPPRLMILKMSQHPAPAHKNNRFFSLDWNIVFALRFTYTDTCVHTLYKLHYGFSSSFNPVFPEDRL